MSAEAEHRHQRVVDSPELVAPPCRLLAAAAVARGELGIARPPVRRAKYDGDVALARAGLSPEEWDGLWAGSASLSLAGAAAVVVRRHGRRDSPTTGWDAVTLPSGRSSPSSPKG